MDHVTGTATVRTAPPFAHVVISGELDLATAPMLASRFREATAAGCRIIRVDLEAVSFCDMSTIRVLDQVDRRVRATGGSLQITAASACVRRIFDLVGLNLQLESDDAATPQPA